MVRQGWLPGHRGTVRMADTRPGGVAEMDFDRLGLMVDPESGRRRVVWALVIVLGYSRHSFAWPLIRQQLGDASKGWKRPGPSSAASPATWYSTTSLPPWPGPTP
mgnify:CR=1 FL=1